jgi:hypothetical protein
VFLLVLIQLVLVIRELSLARVSFTGAWLSAVSKCQ